MYKFREIGDRSQEGARRCKVKDSMMFGSSFIPILSRESVPSDASSVDGSVDTVDGVPMPLTPSESCAGATVGATRGDDAGLNRSPTPSCVPMDKTAVDCTVLSSPSRFFPSGVPLSILSSSNAQDVSATLCPMLEGTRIEAPWDVAAIGSRWRGGDGDVLLLCL